MPAQAARIAPYGLDMPESVPIAFPVDPRKQAAFAYALDAPAWIDEPFARRVRKARAIAQYSFPPDPRNAEPIPGRPARPASMRRASCARRARRSVQQRRRSVKIRPGRNLTF